MQAEIILIILGLVICIFSHPAVRGPLMNRFFNEGVITPQRIKPQKAEVVKYAGPNLSILIIGVVLILVGIIIRIY